MHWQKIQILKCLCKYQNTLQAGWIKLVNSTQWTNTSGGDMSQKLLCDSFYLKKIKIKIKLRNVSSLPSRHPPNTSPTSPNFRQSTNMKHNSIKRCAATQLSAFGLVQKHAGSNLLLAAFRQSSCFLTIRRPFWHAGKKQKMQQIDSRW